MRIGLVVQLCLCPGRFSAASWLWYQLSLEGQEFLDSLCLFLGGKLETEPMIDYCQRIDAWLAERFHISSLPLVLDEAQELSKAAVFAHPRVRCWCIVM
jgi:hypothetical protein